METRQRILLTGASGYVGGRLLQALEARGHDVCCLARRPEFVAARAGPRTAGVRGACRDPDALRGGCAGIGRV
ncbi:MAG: NAD-dependent epimerase/dehydratase family protein [Acidobacteria bacterium]|nr:NAD-dependent epimerase/dehydratase family protein [Acidobacteriota bacterium]